MEKVVWVTADYFADSDLNKNVFSVITRHFEIYWIILEGALDNTVHYYKIR